MIPLLALGLFATQSKSHAADTIQSAQYKDNNNDGTVDLIEWVLDETITNCSFEAGDWSITNPGSINANSLSNISCTGTDNILSITISANANSTGGAVNPIISYSDQGALGSVVLSSGNLSNKSQSISDAAAPKALSASINYNDNISTLTTLFSESINTSSITTSAFHISNISGGKEVTLTIASGSPNGSSITHTLSEYQRANAQEISGTPGGDGGAVVLDIDSNGFQDLNGNANSTNNFNISVAETADTTAPQLVGWEINLKNPEQIMLDFSETINSSSLDASAMTLLGISSQGGIVLEPGFLNIADLDWAIVNITPADIERIKDDTSIATESGNSYLSITSNLIRDLAGNQVNAILPANAILASRFTRRSSGRFRRSKYKKDPNAVEPEINVTGAICGDRIRDVSETCDDGNLIDGDGCSASCQREIYDTPLFPIPQEFETNFELQHPSIEKTESLLLSATNRDEQLLYGKRISKALGVFIRGLKKREKLVETGEYSNAEKNISIIIPQLNILENGPSKLPEPQLSRTGKTISLSFGNQEVNFLRPVFISFDTGIPNAQEILNSMSITDSSGQQIKSLRAHPTSPHRVLFSTNILRPFTVEISTINSQSAFFTDALNDPEYETIVALSNRGVLKGYPDGNYHPERELSKADAVKIIAMTSGIEPDNSWENDLWYEPFARALHYAYIITSLKNPTDKVTKTELLKLIAAAQGINPRNLKNSTAFFSDVRPENPSFALISYAVSTGWLTTTKDTFNPNEKVTRSTAAGWIYRAFLK